MVGKRDSSTLIVDVVCQECVLETLLVISIIQISLPKEEIPGKKKQKSIKKYVFLFIIHFLNYLIQMPPIGAESTST